MDMPNMKLSKLDTFSMNEKMKIMIMKREALKVKPVIYEILNHNPTGLVLAGGCFSSIFHEEIVRDYDVFVLKTEKSVLYDVGNRLLNHLHQVSADDLRNKENFEEAKIRFGNSSYLNNSNNGGKITNTIFNRQTKIQYIFTEYKTREELIDHFDCEHACVSLDLETETLYISRDTYDCINAKTIKKHKNNTILDWRKQKFAERRWKIS